MEREFKFLSACGVEIELMTVEQSGLRTAPFAKDILDVYEDSPARLNSGVAISNELVQHVIEFKTMPPPKNPWAARPGWDKYMREIGQFLSQKGAGLLGTGMHPWFDPVSETKIWAWEDAEIYQWYHRIFDCHRHGFANLQSVHLNIPFQTDAEFALLHGVIRALLPLLPGLCASTPFADGNLSGFMDTRIDVYRNNQNRFPIIAGDVIPEDVYTEEAYYESVFDPLKVLLSTLPDSMAIDSQWLNSRGAIARFDRGSIEIRLMDVQECLDADLAYAQLVFATVVRLCSLPGQTQAKIRKLTKDRLLSILNGAVIDGDSYAVSDEEYLSLLGIPHLTGPITLRELWKKLYSAAYSEGLIAAETDSVLENYFHSGCLSSRIVKACNGDYSHNQQQAVYRKLLSCEMENKPFR